jgi:uncharacterized protein YeaO (DUF488 family)
VKPRPIQLKRVYEAPARQDGLRVLVDRLWPRGLTPQKASADLWLRELAPSARLRRWYGHDPRRWDEFRERYRAELEHAPQALRTLRELRRRGRVTLLFAARSREQNNAVVLRDFLDDKRQGGMR